MKQSKKEVAIFMVTITSTIAVFFLAYQVVATIIYTKELAGFHNINWSREVYGFAINGTASFGNMINVTDLEAEPPGQKGGSTEEWCPNVISERGFVTLGFVGDKVVCCLTHGDTELIPYKEEGGYRHYLCGAWPHLDHVKQPLDKVRIELSKIQELYVD